MRFLFLIAVVMACAMMGWVVYTRPGPTTANAGVTPGAAVTQPVRPVSFKNM